MLPKKTTRKTAPAGGAAGGRGGAAGSGTVAEYFDRVVSNSRHAFDTSGSVGGDESVEDKTEDTEPESDDSEAGSGGGDDDDGDSDDGGDDDDSEAGEWEPDEGGGAGLFQTCAINSAKTAGASDKDAEAFGANAAPALLQCKSLIEAYDVIATALMVLGGVSTPAKQKQYFSYIRTHSESEESNRKSHGVIFSSPHYTSFDFEETVYIERMSSGPRRMTGLFRCPNYKCRSMNTNTLEKQTSGGDEPIKNFHVCFECGNQWKTSG